MVYYAIFLTALFASMVLVAALMHWAPGLGLVDLPDGSRKVHTRAIPRVGGLGMVIATFVAILLWGPLGTELRGFLAGILIIALFGIWDDRSDLDYRVKFLGQLIAVLCVVIPGEVTIGTLSCLHGDSLPHWFAVPLTVLFLMGTTNAMNLSDGLDGLASGLSLLSLFCVLVLAYAADVQALMLISLAIIGGTLGFLRYNTHPAMVFMGDTGSQFLGFSLGVLTIWLTQGAVSALAPELPLLILGLPVIDTLTVMSQRLLRGQSPFKPDRTHFHHKLLNLGFDHYEAVVTIYLIQTVFVVSAYFMRYESAWVILAYYGVLSAALVAFYPLALRGQWQLHHFKPGERSSLTESMLRMHGAKWLPMWSYRLILLSVAAFLIAGAWVSHPWAPDVPRYALLIAGVSVACSLFKLPLRAMVERLALYTLGILATVAVNDFLVRELPPYQDNLQFFFLGLGVLIALAVHLARGEYFSLTPSDYLVMGIILAAAFVPTLHDSRYTMLAIEAAILLYGIEFIMRKQGGRGGRVLWLSCMTGLVLLAVRQLV